MVDTKLQLGLLICISLPKIVIGIAQARVHGGLCTLKFGKVCVHEGFNRKKRIANRLANRCAFLKTKWDTYSEDGAIVKSLGDIVHLVACKFLW